MVGAAPLAPVAPTAAITAALLALLLVWATLYGLKYGYDYTLGAFMRRLADMVDDIWVVGGDLADALLSADRWVQARIADGISSLDRSIARLWDGLTWVVREIGDAITGLAADTKAGLEAIVLGEIPAQIDARTGRLGRDVQWVRDMVRSRIEAEIRARTAGIDRLLRDLQLERLARQAGIDKLAGTLGGLVLPRLSDLEADARALGGYTRGALTRRVSRLEQLVLGGAAAAIALGVLTKYFPFWQCTNVRRFNRALCRAPIGSLDDLLGLALLSVGSLNIEAFARELGGITEGVAVAVDEWVT